MGLDLVTQGWKTNYVVSGQKFCSQSSVCRGTIIMEKSVSFVPFLGMIHLLQEYSISSVGHFWGTIPDFCSFSPQK